MTRSFVKKHVITLVKMRKLEVFTYLLFMILIYDLKVVSLYDFISHI